jgi:hypothetical protein
MKQITLLLTLIVFCFSAITATAAVATAPATTTTITAQKADVPAWKMKIVEKFKAKAISKLTKKGVDADGLLAKDAKWWLKAWLLLWLASILFYIIGALTVGALWYVGYLLSGLGGIAFVIWILKLIKVLD